MNYLYLISFLLLSINCFAFQDSGKFKINAEIKGFEDQTPVFLMNPDVNQIMDTTYVVGNQFEFKGKANSIPENKVLYIPYNNEVIYTYLYIADEDISIKGSKDDFPDQLIVIGSKHHDLKSEYDKLIKNIDQKLQTEQTKVAQMQQANQWNDSLHRAYFDENGVLAKLNEQKINIEKEFAETNLNTYYGLEILNYKKYEYSDTDLLDLTEKIPEKLNDSPSFKAIQNYLENSAITKGDQYADFKAVNKKGETLQLSSFFNQGKYVLLDFSTPTCQFSRSAIPMLQELHKKYNRKLSIVTYYTEANQDHFNYLSSYEGNDWNFLWNNDGKDAFPYIRYRINSTPTYYLFDEKGNLVEKIKGFKNGYFDDTQSKIESLIEI